MSDAALGWVTLLIITAVAVAVVTLAWRASGGAEAAAEKETRRVERGRGCGGVG